MVIKCSLSFDSSGVTCVTCATRVRCSLLLVFTICADADTLLQPLFFTHCEKQVEEFIGTLVPAVQEALCDPSPGMLYRSYLLCKIVCKHYVQLCTYTHNILQYAQPTPCITAIPAALHTVKECFRHSTAAALDCIV
jgi:hypothetical protein